MDKYHEIEKVCFKGERLILKVDGKEYVFLLSKISRKLARASHVEREKYQISPSGYGIHWPLIDEDLSIDGLPGINHIPTQAKQMATA